MKFIQLLSCLSQDIQRLVINLLLLMIILGYASAPITQITIIGEGYIKLQAQECVFNAVITCFLRDFFFFLFFFLSLSLKGSNYPGIFSLHNNMDEVSKQKPMLLFLV